MKSFPKLDDATDGELIFIVHLVPDKWQDEAVQYAKELLRKRGFSEELQKGKAVELKKEIEIEDAREFAQRSQESYSIIHLLIMAFFWYRTIFYDWNLNKNGYRKKRKQRLLAILAGILFYGGMILIEIPFMENERQVKLNEIAQIDLENKKALAKIDWTGTYDFSDSSSTQTKRISWKLIVTKKKNQHVGMLVIGNDSTKLTTMLKKDRIIFIPKFEFDNINGIEFTSNDELFAFTNVNGKIFTQWINLKPNSLGSSNSFGVFFKRK